MPVLINVKVRIPLDPLSTNYSFRHHNKMELRHIFMEVFVTLT